MKNVRDYREVPEMREMRARAVAPIFQALELQGQTRQWLAAHTDASDKRIYTYEYGVAKPPLWFIEQACEAVGISPDVVLTRIAEIVLQFERRAPRTGERQGINAAALRRGAAAVEARRGNADGADEAETDEAEQEGAIA